MKWKAWLLVLVLMPAINAFAAAQVEERELKGNAVETAQRKADFARKRAMDAEQQVRAAEREVAEAERYHRDADATVGAWQHTRTSSGVIADCCRPSAAAP